MIGMQNTYSACQITFCYLKQSITILNCSILN